MYILEKELKKELSRQEKMKLYEDISYLENEKEVAFPREVSTIKYRISSQIIVKLKMDKFREV